MSKRKITIGDFVQRIFSMSSILLILLGLVLLLLADTDSPGIVINLDHNFNKPLIVKTEGTVKLNGNIRYYSGAYDILPHSAEESASIVPTKAFIIPVRKGERGFVPISGQIECEVSGNGREFSLAFPVSQLPPQFFQEGSELTLLLDVRAYYRGTMYSTSALDDTRHPDKPGGAMIKMQYQL